MRKYKKIFINCMVAGALVVSTMTGCGAASKSAGEETQHQPMKCPSRTVWQLHKV